MRRFVFVSAAVLAALIGAGVRSLNWYDAVSIGIGQYRKVSIDSGRGSLSLRWVSDTGGASERWNVVSLRIAEHSDIANWEPRLWTHVRPVYGNRRMTILNLAIPYWALTLVLLAVVIILGIRKHRLAKRAVTRPCRHCGYDLTGNVSGTCPECGNAVTVNSASQS